MTGPVERCARVVEVHALERGRESVGVAFAPHLSVGDDVDARPLHVAYGDERGIVLRLLEKLGRDTPDLLRPYARRKS